MRDGHVLLADVGLLQDQLEQAGAFLLLLLEQFLDLLGGQQAVLDQGVGDAFAKCFDWRHGLSGRLCGRLRPVPAGGTRYHSSRLGVASASSLAACWLNGLAVATRTDLLMRSNGNTHQRWQVSAGKLRARSMSMS